MPYVTKLEIKLAERAGYKHTRSTQNGDSFKLNPKGIACVRHVWAIFPRGWAGDYRVQWQTADIINGYFCHHKSYRFLTDAFERAAS